MQNYIETNLTKEAFYLESSILERYFKRAVLLRKRRFVLPHIFRYLKCLGVKLVTSSWTLAEVFEHLWKNYNLEQKEISEIFHKFLKEFGITIISDFETKAKILTWIKKFKLEAKDTIHLFISKENGLCLLTADNKLASRGTLVYSNILIPEELFLEFSSIKVKS